jgi:hypothetical protein
MGSMTIRRAVLAAGLTTAAALFVASLAAMPAHPEGPPRPLPWYLFYASFAVAALTISAVAICAWRSDESRRRDLGVRTLLLTGILVTLGLVGLAFHAYLSPPHNLVECERNGLPPHQLACSYANRNTPLAHEQAASLAGAGVVVFLGTLAVLGGAERRRLHRRHEVPIAQR